MSNMQKNYDPMDDYEEDGAEDDFCPRCDGSGEGFYDGSSCGLCGGSGHYSG